MDNNEQAVLAEAKPAKIAKIWTPPAAPKKRGPAAMLMQRTQIDEDTRLRERVEAIGAASSSTPAIAATARIEAVARRVRSKLQGD